MHVKEEQEGKLLDFRTQNRGGLKSIFPLKSDLEDTAICSQTSWPLKTLSCSSS